MRRLLAEIPDIRTSFEAFHGHKPDQLLDRHPAGRLVALHVEAPRANVEQAGVWELGTGRLVWAPEDTILLAWADGGHQVLLLRCTFHPDLDHPPILATPLQSEFTHVLERRSWPEKKLLGWCEIDLPSGWAWELTNSPTSNLAAVTWIEQDCAGFVLVRWGTEEGDFQIEGIGRHGHGYRVEPNLIRGPVFSPDGRYAVASCTLWRWWTPEGDPETPSPGGRFKTGHIAILDTETMTFSEREVVTEVPAGWLPPDTEFGGTEMLGVPEFAAPRAVRVEIPTGAVESFEIP